MSELRQRLDSLYPQLPQRDKWEEGAEETSFWDVSSFQPGQNLLSAGICLCFERLNKTVLQHVQGQISFGEDFEKAPDFLSQPKPAPEELADELNSAPRSGQVAEANKPADSAEFKPDATPENTPQGIPFETPNEFLTEQGERENAPITLSRFATSLMETYFPSLEEDSQESREIPDGLSPEALNFYTLIEKEIKDAEALGSLVMIPLSTMQRMRKAQQAFLQNRLTEALTVLKTAKREDPKNRSLTFVISQLYYYRAHQGMNEFLPEAREEAFKACVQDDVLPEEKQLYYRYRSMASERPFSVDRCLNMMREYYLLNPDAMEGDGGMESHSMFHLYSWVILSTIPHNLWGEFEVKALYNLAEKVVCGMPFYLYFFHPLVEEALKAENDIFNPFKDLKAKLGQSYFSYQGILLPFKTHFNPQTFRPKQAPNLLWTCKSRYLKLFLESAPLPQFDEILAHISLDGRRYDDAAYPTVELHKKGLTHTSYWHTWAISIACDGQNRRNRIPTAAVAREAEFLMALNHILQALMAEETGQLNFQKMEKAGAYFDAYTLEEIKENVEESSVFNSVRYGPVEVYLKSYYRNWQEGQLQSNKLYDLFNIVASNGGFADPLEAYALFHILEKNYMHNSANGPARRLEKAWERYQLKEFGIKPALMSSGSGFSGLFGEHFSQTWWFYLLVLPAAGITFILVQAAGNMQSAFKFILVLLGVLAFFALVVYNFIQKK